MGGEWLMAIYLGSQKYKIHFAHNLFKTNLAASIIATFIPKNVLISSDNYLLIWNKCRLGIRLADETLQRAKSLVEKKGNKSVCK